MIVRSSVRRLLPEDARVLLWLRRQDALGTAHQLPPDLAKPFRELPQPGVEFSLRPA